MNRVKNEDPNCAPADEFKETVALAAAARADQAGLERASPDHELKASAALRVSHDASKRIISITYLHFWVNIFASCAVSLCRPHQQLGRQKIEWPERRPPLRRPPRAVAPALEPPPKLNRPHELST